MQPQQPVWTPTTSAHPPEPQKGRYAHPYAAALNEPGCHASDTFSDDYSSIHRSLSPKSRHTDTALMPSSASRALSPEPT